MSQVLLLLFSPLNSSSQSEGPSLGSTFSHYLLIACALVASYVNTVDPRDVSSRALCLFHVSSTLGTSFLCLEIFLSLDLSEHESYSQQ